MARSQNSLLRRLLSLPTLGGWLSILHCFLVLIAVRSEWIWPRLPAVVRESLAWILFTPFKAVFLSPRLFLPEAIPAFMLAAAIDSFLWGYGLAFVGRLLVRCWRRAGRASPTHERRFRFSLKTLLLVQFAVVAFLALAHPRIITGHFCYITINQLITTESGSVFVSYSQFASPGVVCQPELSTLGDPSGRSCGWSGTRSGAFRWYARHSHSVVGHVDLAGMGLGVADLQRAMQVQVGKTYHVALGDRLVLYHLPDPRYANRPYVGFIKVNSF